MANAVEFILSLKNKLSGPAMAAKKSLDGVKSSLYAVNSASSGMARASGLGERQLFKFGATSKGVGNVADVLSKVIGGRMAVGFVRAHGSVSRLGASLPSLGEMASSAGAGLASMGGAVLGVGAAIASVAVGGLGLAAAGAKYAGEMGAFKEQTLFAYKYILGSSDKADMMFREADALAGVMGARTTMVAESMRELMGGGFSQTQSKDITAAIADVAALNPTANVGAISAQLAQMKGAGRVLAEDLKPLLNAGLNDDVFYQVLREMTGKSDQKDLKKLLEAGKVDADTGIAAIMETVNRMGGSKGLGSVAAARANETMGGQIDSAKAMFERLFMSISSGPASGAMGSLAKQVTAFLDPKGSSGQRILATLNAIASAATSVLASLSGGTLRSILDGLLAGFEAVWPISKAFFGGFMAGFQEAFGAVKVIFAAFNNGKGPTLDLVGIAKALGTAFAWVAVGIGAVVAIIGALSAGIGLVIVGIGTAIVDLVGWIGTTVGEVMDSMTGHWGDIGLNIVKGIAVGMTGGIGEIIAAATSIGSAAVDALRTLLRIQSPSKVTAEIGGYTAEGFTMGVEGGAPAASAAVGALVAPGPLRSFGTGGASVSGVTVNLTVNVDGGDSAEEVAGAAVEKIKSAMTDVFRGIAIELGAAPEPV